jgi:hypothetical protein
MKARELIDAHGANAESVALQLMTQSMQTDEVEETTFWLSVIHEIRQLATSAGLVN